jgi:hypothetical protein
MEPIDLKELLFRIVQSQNEHAAMLIAMRADIETVTLSLSVIAPQFSANLGKALEANRQRYAQEFANKKAELELLRATVSKVVM